MSTMSKNRKPFCLLTRSGRNKLLKADLLHCLEDGIDSIEEKNYDNDSCQNDVESESGDISDQSHSNLNTMENSASIHYCSLPDASDKNFSYSSTDELLTHSNTDESLSHSSTDASFPVAPGIEEMDTPTPTMNDGRPRGNNYTAKPRKKVVRTITSESEEDGITKEAGNKIRKVSGEKSNGSGPMTEDSTDLKFKKILRTMLFIKRAILDMNERLTSLEQSSGKSQIGRSEDQEEEMGIGLEFPLGTQEELDTLEEKIKDVGVRKKLISELVLIGGNTSKEMTIRTLRYVMKDSVAANYSWIGYKKKRVFSELGLKAIIFDAVRHSHLSASAKELENYIKDWLRHAKFRDAKKKGIDHSGDAGQANC